MNFRMRIVLGGAGTGKALSTLQPSHVIREPLLPRLLLERMYGVLVPQA